MARWFIRHTHPTYRYRCWNCVCHWWIIFISTTKRKLNIWHSKYTSASYRKDTIIVYINQRIQNAIGERNLVGNKYYFFICVICVSLCIVICWINFMYSKPTPQFYCHLLLGYVLRSIINLLQYIFHSTSLFLYFK